MARLFRPSRLVTGLAVVLITAGCALVGGSSAGDPSTADLTTKIPRRSADPSQGPTARVPTTTDGDPAASGPLPVGAVADVASLAEAERATCSFDQPVPLPVNPKCYDVSVPENWADPDPDDRVVIHVALFEAREERRDEALIYLDGGPGGKTLESLPYSFGSLVKPFLGPYDFIVYDQRGIGESDPALRCPELTEINIADIMGAIDPDDLLTETLEAQDACSTRLLSAGVDLTAYNSIASANDLEAIRVALGYEQFNAIGISYGTRLGQTYMRMYPDSLRSLVLDSVFPTEANLWSNVAFGAERAFRQLFAGCAQSPECAATYPNFEDDYFRLLDQLDADPATVTFSNFITGASTPSQLTGDDVLGLTFQSLYSRGTFSLLPEVTAKALEGDYGVLEAMGSSVVTSLGFVSAGMQLSVECNEEIPFESGDDRNSYRPSDPRYRRLETLAGSGFFESCPTWPSGQAPAVENETVVSEVPTLLLAGQYDPITPPSGMDTIAAGLTTSFQFLLPHEGHGITPTPCGAELIGQFITDPSSAPDGSCIEDTPAPPWVETFGPDEITLVEFESVGVAAVRGLRPDGWVDSGFGTFARAANVLDPTLVLFQQTQGFPPEFMASVVGEQLETVLAPAGSFDLDGVEWQRFVAEIEPGVQAEAIVSSGPGAILAMLVANDDEFDTLRQQVLLPGAQAAEPI